MAAPHTKEKFPALTTSSEPGEVTLSPLRVHEAPSLEPQPRVTEPPVGMVIVSPLEISEPFEVMAGVREPNVAVTFFAESIVTVHSGAVPVQSPDQVTAGTLAPVVTAKLTEVPLPIEKEHGAVPLGQSELTGSDTDTLLLLAPVPFLVIESR